MPPKILLTGIPGHFTRLIERADGRGVVYTENQPRPESKEAFLKELRNISNTGNYLIGEGALQALSPNATHIPFWHLWNGCRNGRGLDEINAHFDICVFTCANLLRKSLSTDAEALVLANIEMPIVMLGIGIQSRDDPISSLPEGTRNLMNVLKQKQHYFLTRGEAAAGFLRDEGFSSVRPVGCPSVYLMPGNVRTALAGLRDVQVGEGRTVFSGYLGGNLDAIADINALTSPDATAFYVMQDEPLIFDMQLEPNDDGRIYDCASGELIGNYTFKGADSLERPLKVHAFFDTNQWRAWASTMNFSFGSRFHGNIITLQASVPSLMVAVDDRMREMLEFVGLPYIDKADLNGASNRAEIVTGYLANLDTAAVIDQYDERERGFRLALQEVGIA